MYQWKTKSILGFKGFTLAELLSALAILGVIATFTIPKVLNASTNGQFNATAKEAAGMLTEAYGAYRLENSDPSGTMSWVDITPYMNYVRVDTATNAITSSGGSDFCGNGGRTCLRLHNGSLIWAGNVRTFGGTSDLNANFIYFNPAPDDGVTRAVAYILYYNGRFTSRPHMLSGTVSSAGAISAGTDPTWFEW